MNKKQGSYKILIVFECLKHNESTSSASKLAINKAAPDQGSHERPKPDSVGQ